MARPIRHILALCFLSAASWASASAPSALGRADQGALAFRDRDFDRAIEEFTAAILSNQLTDEQLAVTYHHRGVTYHNNGDAGRAALDYSMALAKGLPRDKFHRALNNRGLVYDALGDRDAALGDFARAIAAQPDYAEAYANRCNVLRKKKEYAQAVGDCERAVRLNHPRPAQPIMSIGLALEAMGRERDAMAYFRRALELEPEYAEARDKLAALSAPTRQILTIRPDPTRMEAPVEARQAEDPAAVFKGAAASLTVTSAAFGLQAAAPVISASASGTGSAKVAGLVLQGQEPRLRPAQNLRPTQDWTGGPAAPLPLSSAISAAARPSMRGENNLAGAQSWGPGLDKLVTAEPKPLPHSHPNTAVAPTAQRFTSLSMVPTRPPLINMVPDAQTTAAREPVIITAAPLATEVKAADGYQLQLGAYASEDQATKGWRAYQETHGAALVGINPRVLEGAGRNNKTVYRLFAISLPDRDAATKLCRRLMGANGACLISEI